MNLNMLDFIVATEIQLFLNKFWFPQTKPSWLVRQDDITQRHLAIVLAIENALLCQLLCYGQRQKWIITYLILFEL